MSLLSKNAKLRWIFFFFSLWFVLDPARVSSVLNNDVKQFGKQNMCVLDMLA
jgi:hypothetical protein